MSDSATLERWGLPTADRIAQRLADGYWTPWHIAVARIAELEAANAEHDTLRLEGLGRIAELEAERDKAREAGHEEVLAFIRNGRFLSDSAPTARFAREIEAGWKSWGKAQAEKNRANHGPRVADASFSQEALVSSRGEGPSALPSPTEEDGA
jgi:hypothetical protein